MSKYSRRVKKSKKAHSRKIQNYRNKKTVRKIRRSRNKSRSRSTSSPSNAHNYNPPIVMSTGSEIAPDIMQSNRLYSSPWSNNQRVVTPEVILSADDESRSNPTNEGVMFVDDNSLHTSDLNASNGSLHLSDLQ